MIKTGIYGLLRVLTLPRPPPAWWGWTLVAVGARLGRPRRLTALAQHDLKRLLAYHSVENIGIIALGLGAGAARASPTGNAGDGRLGFAGALLHVVNHAAVQEPAVPRRRLGAARHRHARHRPAGRTAQAHAVDRARRFLVGAVGDLRPAAAERLRQRVPDLSRRRSAGWPTDRHPAPLGLPGIVAMPGWR